MFDAEPVPNQEVILNRMGGDNFISRLDLTKGFWQIPIKEEDRKYTAFSTDQGLMQFKYMPFGLVNALAIFCRMVRKLLYDVNYVDACVDDIVPHTATWDDHNYALVKTGVAKIETTRIDGKTFEMRDRTRKT